MITILGISLTYEAISFFALFIASEVIGANPKLKQNTVCQFILKFATISKYGRTEDDQLSKISKILNKGGSSNG